MCIRDRHCGVQGARDEQSHMEDWITITGVYNSNLLDQLYIVYVTQKQAYKVRGLGLPFVLSLVPIVVKIVIWYFDYISSLKH